MTIKTFVQKMRKMTWKNLKFKLSNKFFDLADELKDRRICGRSLVKYVPSIYRDDANGVGMTGSHSTRYSILKTIFSHVKLSREDVFLDVGCGKGRVLAYLTGEKTACELYGVEINPVSAAVAKEWTRRYSNIHIIEGDAFELDFDRYTVLFLNRPFLPKTFGEFLEKLESDLTHPITFIYWVDQQSGWMLKDRAGWTAEYRGRIYKIHGMPVVRSPQGYSVWTYEPEKSNK